MDRLTRKEIEDKTNRILTVVLDASISDDVRDLRALALQSLSIESVRSEARGDNAYMKGSVEAIQHPTADATEIARRWPSRALPDADSDRHRDFLTLEQIIGLKDALLGHHIPPCTQEQWRYVCDLAIRSLSPARVAEGEPELTGELVVGNGHFHAGVKLSTVQACIDRHIARQTEEESTRLRDEFVQSLAPESPAKEQPGEQNAAPQERVRADVSSQGNAPAVAAPDVASMVKRLEELQSAWLPGVGECYPITFTPVERTALLAKLGQGWIPCDAWFPSAELRPCKRCGAQRTKLPDDSPPPPERP